MKSVAAAAAAAVVVVVVVTVMSRELHHNGNGINLRVSHGNSNKMSIKPHGIGLVVVVILC